MLVPFTLSSMQILPSMASLLAFREVLHRNTMGYLARVKTSLIQKVTPTLSIWSYCVVFRSSSINLFLVFLFSLELLLFFGSLETYYNFSGLQFNICRSSIVRFPLYFSYLG